MGLIDDNHIYSYTQLTSVSECPYSFYLSRIERDENGKRLKEEPNGFAELGTLIHDILDKWSKKELTAEELTLEYDLRFEDEVVTPFPRMMKDYRDKAFDIGHRYFASFDRFEGFKILASEQKFETDMFGRRFIGIVDMLLEDEKTGELIICDHKSKSLTAFRKAEDEMYRQQLLYSKFVFEKYGRYPDRLMFNLFKEMGLKKERPFTLEAYNEALAWAKEMIERIENYEVLDFMEAKEPDFFCTEICGMRKHCSNGSAQLTKKK